MNLRVIVVDDEESMRFVLRKALEKMSNIEVVGEAGRGDEAVLLLERVSPDAVFMDVEMPGLDGIEAAKLMIDIKPKVMIVFITAHQQYMPQAFGLYAFDYMVKPFKLDRLQETIQRMKLLQPQAIQKEKEPSSQPRLEGILLKNREGMALIYPEDVILVQRENRTTTILTEGEKYTTSETLTELEEKLPAGDFIRSHKSYIINIHKIKRIFPYGRWTYTVQLKGIKEDALLTSEKAKELEERFHWTVG